MKIQIRPIGRNYINNPSQSTQKIARRKSPFETIIRKKLDGQACLGTFNFQKHWKIWLEKFHLKTLATPGKNVIIVELLKWEKLLLSWINNQLANLLWTGNPCMCHSGFFHYGNEHFSTSLLLFALYSMTFKMILISLLMF